MPYFNNNLSDVELGIEEEEDPKELFKRFLELRKKEISAVNIKWRNIDCKSILDIDRNSIIILTLVMSGIFALGGISGYAFHSRNDNAFSRNESKYMESLGGIGFCLASFLSLYFIHALYELAKRDAKIKVYDMQELSQQSQDIVKKIMSGNVKNQEITEVPIQNNNLKAYKLLRNQPELKEMAGKCEKEDASCNLFYKQSVFNKNNLRKIEIEKESLLEK